MLCERFIGRFQRHYGGAGRLLNTHDLCKLERVLAPECQPFKEVFFFLPATLSLPYHLARSATSLLPQIMRQWYALLSWCAQTASELYPCTTNIIITVPLSAKKAPANIAGRFLMFIPKAHKIQSNNGLVFLPQSIFFLLSVLWIFIINLTQW